MRPLIVAALLGLIVGCSHPPAQSQNGATTANRKIVVATTISTLNSFVQGVGGEHVIVKNIVPIGASPETFAPSPQDVATVSDANVLVENGAGLESWLDRLLRDAGTSGLARGRLYRRAARKESQPARVDGSRATQRVTSLRFATR